MHAEATSEKVALGWYLDGRYRGGRHPHARRPPTRACCRADGVHHRRGMTGARGGVIGVRASSRSRHAHPHAAALRPPTRTLDQRGVDQLAYGREAIEQVLGQPGSSDQRRRQEPPVEVEPVDASWTRSARPPRRRDRHLVAPRGMRPVASAPGVTRGGVEPRRQPVHEDATLALDRRATDEARPSAKARPRSSRHSCGSDVAKRARALAARTDGPPRSSRGPADARPDSRRPRPTARERDYMTDVGMTGARGGVIRRHPGQAGRSIAVMRRRHAAALRAGRRGPVDRRRADSAGEPTGSPQRSDRSRCLRHAEPTERRAEPSEEQPAPLGAQPRGNGPSRAGRNDPSEQYTRRTHRRRQAREVRLRWKRAASAHRGPARERGTNGIARSIPTAVHRAAERTGWPRAIARTPRTGQPDAPGRDRRR